LSDGHERQKSGNALSSGHEHSRTSTAMRANTNQVHKTHQPTIPESNLKGDNILFFFWSFTHVLNPFKEQIGQYIEQDNPSWIKKAKDHIIELSQLLSRQIPKFKKILERLHKRPFVKPTNVIYLSQKSGTIRMRRPAYENMPRSWSMVEPRTINRLNTKETTHSKFYKGPPQNEKYSKYAYQDSRGKPNEELATHLPPRCNSFNFFSDLTHSHVKYISQLRGNISSGLDGLGDLYSTKPERREESAQGLESDSDDEESFDEEFSDFEVE
jgi:hypothetical protein